ncbi:MAG: type II toxin-antitoxin system HicB family antitoxin [Patescibacteria group bacterium]
MPRLQPRQFKVLIERDEDGFFVATVPSLPGCYTQAKTLAELNKRIKEAIKLCLDVESDDPEYQEKISQFSYEPSFVGMEVVSLNNG